MPYASFSAAGCIRHLCAVMRVLELGSDAAGRRLNLRTKLKAKHWKGAAKPFTIF